MDHYEFAQQELKNNEFRTFNQFMSVMDSAYCGTFSQAGELFNRYGFCAHSYTELLVDYCEELVNDRFLVESLKDLAVIVELAKTQKIHELERQNIDSAIKLQSLN